MTCALSQWRMILGHINTFLYIYFLGIITLGSPGHNSKLSYLNEINIRNWVTALILHAMQYGPIV